MIVLDTNVVSELMRPEPQTSVLEWVDAQDASELWLCSVVVSELLYGVARLPEGQRKQRFAQALAAMLDEDFEGRVLPFDVVAAVSYAELLAKREQQGQPMAMADAQIAATCLAHGASLATRNTRDFAGSGLKLIDPFEEV